MAQRFCNGVSGFAVLALLAATPAAAEGPANPSWSGLSIGGSVGFAASKITSVNDAVSGISSEVVYQFADKNVVYSLHAGYDQEFGDRFVGGVELSADWLGVQIAPFDSGGFGNLFSAGFDVTASARAGMLTDPKTLVYARGGLSLIATSAEAGISDRDHDLLPAAVFGAGVETILVDNLSARLEGTYTLPLRSQYVTEDQKSFNPRMIKVMAGLTWRLDADRSSDRTVVVASDKVNFQGGYIGALLGYQLGQVDVPVSTAGATIGPFASEAPLGGFTAGYDMRIDNIVAGIGFDIQRTNPKFYDPGQNSPLEGSTELFAQMEGTAFVTGRVGLVATPSTLVYGKVGYGAILTTANPDFFTFGSGGTKLLPAIQWGAGIETMLNENMSFRLEGMHTKAQSGFVVDLAQNGQATILPSGIAASAGLNLRF